IPPSSSISFAVAFKPLAAAAISGSVMIVSNVSSAAFTVPLSGAGVAPPQPAATGITVFTDRPAYKRGQPVNISGKGTQAGGAGIPNLPVQIRVTANGSTRTLNPYTDFQGSYQTAFIPTPTEGGSYSVTAFAGSGGATQTEIANFRIVGLLED